MIDLSHLKGRRYGVFGLGRTGMAAVKALVAGGAEVLAWDDTASQRQAAEDAGAELADFATAPLNYLEAIVWSPGAPFLAPKPLPAAMAAAPAPARRGAPSGRRLLRRAHRRQGTRGTGVVRRRGRSRAGVGLQLL